MGVKVKRSVAGNAGQIILHGQWMKRGTRLSSSRHGGETGDVGASVLGIWGKAVADSNAHVAIDRKDRSRHVPIGQLFPVRGCECATVADDYLASDRLESGPEMLH